MSYRASILQAILDQQEKSLLEIQHAIKRLQREIDEELKYQDRFELAINATRAMIKQEEFNIE